MSNSSNQDWAPQSDSVQGDQRAAYDQMREDCPVAYSEYAHWSVFRHKDVLRVLLDHETFSSHVSRFASVPNGMDPPQHTRYRELINPYFSAEKVAEFEPLCEKIADSLAQSVLCGEQVELMEAFAQPFALQVQCAFMGWPLSMQGTLLSWVQRNNQAIFKQDRALLAELAAEFEAIIAGLIAERRQAKVGPDCDVTGALMHEEIDGRLLNNAEIASILRNWTVGEVGTIAASVGIIAHFFATNPEWQARLRESPDLLWKANDEILRIHGPLVGNRRRNTCPVEIGGRQIPAGERISVNWIAANRDPQVFPQPDQFSLERNPADNLLYGAGVHVCPGAPLSRMELVVVARALLRSTDAIRLLEGQPPVLAGFPASGYARLPLALG
ncbi:Cytochrome P450 [gamma proteobacterium HdN1]|nr:Cytochrome P450 [gamma proteobacterium HdN1]